MITTPMDVLHQFPVRKTKKQKQAFRDAVQSYAQSLGYKTKTEKGRWGVENVVIGDPETARYLIAARCGSISGTVTLLETAVSMPFNLRERVCFAILDGSVLGAASYREKHRYASDLQTVLYLDRVADGDTILLTPTDGLKDNREALDRLIALEGRCGEKRILVRDQKKSAKMPFPKGLRICARQGRLPKLRDTLPAYTNVNILRASLITFIGGAVE